jgi:hypothetical protein
MSQVSVWKMQPYQRDRHNHESDDDSNSNRTDRDQTYLSSAVVDWVAKTIQVQLAGAQAVQVS